jgi:hypothetical protein
LKTGTLQKIASGALSVLAAAAMAVSAHAGTTLIVGTGWINDEVTAQDTPSLNSTITFTVGAGQEDVFSLTDCCLAGDVYQVTIDGSTVATSTFTSYPIGFNGTLGDTYYQQFWGNNDYSHLQLVFLEPGTYTVSIEDISDVEYPASVGYRLDSVPEPATWALFLTGFGLAGFALRRRNRLANAV